MDTNHYLGTSMYIFGRGLNSRLVVKCGRRRGLLRVDLNGPIVAIIFFTYRTY